MVQLYTVVIKANRYIPNTLHLNVGDEVVWDNQDSHHHTASSSLAGLMFDTGEILGNSKSRTLRFDHASQPSGLEYYCSYHEYMVGRLFVLPPAYALSIDPNIPDYSTASTYDLDTWNIIARLVAAHWVLDMAEDFAYAMTIHRASDLDEVNAAWEEVETWWRQRVGATGKIIMPNPDPKLSDLIVDFSSFGNRSRTDLESLGRQIRVAYVKVRPRVFRFPAPIRPDAVLHPGELYEGQSTDPFGEAITVNFVEKPVQDAEVRHEEYAGALYVIERALDTGNIVSEDEKLIYRTARSHLTVADFHLLASHLYGSLSEFFGSADFVEDMFLEGIRRMTKRGEWDGSVFPLWHWLRWIDGYICVKTTNQIPDPVGLA